MAEERGVVKDTEASDVSQQTFLVNLYKFMKDRGTPIERIPHLGFKQVNLATLYKAVEKLGGYEAVTTSRLWKNIYDELGGNPGSTSAATCTRRHYERLVLPYERHLKGEDDKPLPVCQPRKQYKVIKAKDGRGAGAEVKEQSSKRKAARDGVQRGGRSHGVSPPADAEDAGRGQSEGAPRELPEERKCPGADGAPPAEKGGGRSPGRAGEEGWGAGGLGEEGRPLPASRREQDIISPLAKKKRFVAEAAPSPARPSVIRPAPSAPPPHLYAGREEEAAAAGEVRSRGCDLPPAPRCLTGLQNVVKPLLHLPAKGSPYSCCRGFRDPGGFGLPPDKGARRLSRAGERGADLRLPRAAGQAPWTPDCKGEAPRMGPSAAPSLETPHPKACWVPPLSVALPRKVPAKRPKVDGGVGHPRPGPDGRPREGEAPSGRKLRVVSPLHLGKDRGEVEGEGKGLKPPLPPVPAWLLAAPSAPNPALSDRFPASYLLPVKEQTLYSSLIPSLALNSFMVPAVPGDGVGAPGHPLDLYKHLAAGSSYENFLRHRLYPLAACCPAPYLPAFHVRPQL
ncbi:AT-rich interactive domain-containing protein 5A-like [Pristis pectinata]|uniref:AT-rich interactive domain-containing protein 5A-like n=1 Tax=Pristis pectinata TaxID=685728 RepID=UPI00223CF05D|nr:AT-rich interactive domain-containing protein 5A-like [Pristis pectinata]XP_051896939.1 AT-rich interactive domain-containing protein 5A-like [Pristis pectinata]